MKLRLRIARSLIAVSLVAGTTVVVLAPATVAGADESVVSISAGEYQTCAVTTGGAAECWGWDQEGQLGDGEHGNGVRELTPTVVTGLGSGVTSVAAGGASCALTTGGAVKCWGEFGNGELGNGTTTGSVLPVDVSGLGSGVVAITADGPSCALTDVGAVKCWGDNTYGALGDGTTNPSTVPVDVSGLGSGMAAVSAGETFACALTTGGAVECWGDNSRGQLGDGTTTSSMVPVDVTGLGAGVVAISAKYTHACALTTAGAVECWGENLRGQLGDGTTTNRLVPVEVSGLGAGVVSIAAGGEHTCAVLAGGSTECWGRNSFGELGDASSVDSLTPVPVTGLGSGVTEVAAGYDHNCALSSAGAASCWGYDEQGELGDGMSAQVLSPVGVLGLGSGVAQIGEGYHHTCAVTSAGALLCWGLNDHGQLGDGTTLERDEPVPVVGLGADVASVVGGYDHTCVLTTGGAVKCWGDNKFGQLGDGTNVDRHTPVDVSGLGSGVVEIDAGTYSTCAVLSSGTAKCWGANPGGLLGDGSMTRQNVPVAVSGLASTAAELSISSTACALEAGGGVQCWGLLGEVGNGVPGGSSTPVVPTGLGSGVAEVSAGADYNCALTTGGAVKCWGNGYGGFESVPTSVAGLSSGVSVVSNGPSLTCVLTTTGGVKCWGENQLGAVGDGTGTDRAFPADVLGLGSGVKSLTAKGDHACALTYAGSVDCWGGNYNGQIGIGASGTSSVPVGVVGLGLGSASIPGAPGGVAVAPTSAGANVSWKPPARTGHSHVYGYAVTVISGSGGPASGVTGPKIRTTTGTWMHFSGLTNGIGYRLDVAPINRAGIGVSAVSTVVEPGSRPATPTGYWMVDSAGTVYPFGHVADYGDARPHTSLVTHIEPTPTRRGYWIVTADGSVYPFGDAFHLPGAGALAPGESVVGLASTATGHGFWLFTNRGRVIARGDAKSYGDLHTKTLRGPIVDAVATPTGHGYYMVGSDGGVFTFGDARFHGSMGGSHLNRPVNGLVPDANGTGYWLVASDGGIFAFNAPFRGSMGGTHLNRPVVGMVRYGNGYLMAAADGGVFDFSNTPFAGSLGAHPPVQPIVSIASGQSPVVPG